MILNQQFKINQKAEKDKRGWWNWAVWIEAPIEKLDQVDYAIYTLHPSIAENERKITVRETKFRLEERSWASFTIHILIYLKDNTIINIDHELILGQPEEKVKAEPAEQLVVNETISITDFQESKSREQEISIEDNDIIELVFDDNTTWIGNSSILKRIFPQNNTTR